ncbi:hypothetical protein OG271_23115 [Micromonospora rifamycinica]|nr:hypothetical protein [Micromonospora rifamycinica]
MQDGNKRRRPTRHSRLVLTVVGSAVAGAARALVGWLLDQWG